MQLAGCIVFMLFSRRFETREIGTTVVILLLAALWRPSGFRRRLRAMQSWQTRPCAAYSGAPTAAATRV
jgi:hypothetical protein